MAKEVAEGWFQCPKCKGHFSREGFYSNHHNGNLLQTECKSCSSKRIRLYTSKHLSRYTGKNLGSLVRFLTKFDR